MSYPPVTTKKDFVRRYVNGEFGNTGPQWPTLEAYLQSGYKGLVHIRSRIAGAPTYYNVPSNQVHRTWHKVAHNSGLFYLAAMAPHEHNLLQGEVQHRADGLYLYYSTAQELPMRDALKQQPQHARGIIALSLLRWALCANSYEWLQVLFERYPNHVIELSAFSCDWGTIPNHNTAFWEVRMY